MGAPTRADTDQPPEIKLGRYECEGQPPVIVTNNGNTGPWIKWHFDWETPDEATKSIWFEFHAMLQTGYKHVEEKS